MLNFGSVATWQAGKVVSSEVACIWLFKASLSVASDNIHIILLKPQFLWSSLIISKDQIPSARQSSIINSNLTPKKGKTIILTWRHNQRDWSWQREGHPGLSHARDTAAVEYWGKILLTHVPPTCNTTANQWKQSLLGINTKKSTTEDIQITDIVNVRQISSPQVPLQILNFWEYHSQVYTINFKPRIPCL